MKWEKPKLISLNGNEKAQGQCGPGSGDATCTLGATAAVLCGDGGLAGGCQAGVDAVT